MSTSSSKALQNLLLKLPGPDPRIAVVGIGNTLRSDDAAGTMVARTLQGFRSLRDREDVLILDAGHAPENRTADLRRFAPDAVLLIDAAEMSELPGTVRFIEMEEIEGMSASTHSLPLSMLAKYLTLELNCSVALLGIQPLSNEVGETVSAPVLQSVSDLARDIEDVLRISLSYNFQPEI